MAKPTGTPELRRITLLRDSVAAWDAYPFSVPAIASLARIDVTSRVLFFVGENGSGKSTLLEALALACGFGREGGTRNFSFSTQNDSASETNAAERAVDALADALRLSWGKRQRDGFFLRAESFYNVATYLDRLERSVGRALGSYGDRSLHTRSHGESFLTLLLERFSGNGLSFDRGRLQPTTYEETDAYIITRRFLADHRRASDELFAADAAAE